jgi:hypothetical protein
LGTPDDADALSALNAGYTRPAVEFFDRCATTWLPERPAGYDDCGNKLAEGEAVPPPRMLNTHQYAKLPDEGHLCQRAAPLATLSSPEGQADQRAVQLSVHNHFCFRTYCLANGACRFYCPWRLRERTEFAGHVARYT